MAIRFAEPVKVEMTSEPAPCGSPLKTVMYRVATAAGVVLPVNQLSMVLETVAVNTAISALPL
jgi:hypothetical protein